MPPLNDPRYPNPSSRFSILFRTDRLPRHKIQIRELTTSQHELTNWKQLLTLGSILLPPKEATSPSCRGIWMESCSRSPSRRWSQKPVELATCLNRSGGRKRTSMLKHHNRDMANSAEVCIVSKAHKCGQQPRWT